MESKLLTRKRNLAKVVTEFFKTEVEYNEHLQNVWHHFGQYFTAPHRFPNETWHWPKDWTNAIIMMGFFQLRSIQLYSSAFLEQLRDYCKPFEEDKIREGTDVSTPLWQLSNFIANRCEGFIVYSPYITIFDTFLKAIGYLKNSPRVLPSRNIFQNKEKEFIRESHRITDIGGLIILPTQRMTRYPLMFEEIMKKCDPASDGNPSNAVVSPEVYAKVVEAMYKFKGVTMLINEERSMGFLGEDHRQYKRLHLEDFVDRDGTRKFLHKSTLKKKKTKKGEIEDYNIILFNDVLVIEPVDGDVVSGKKKSSGRLSVKQDGAGAPRKRSQYELKKTKMKLLYGEPNNGGELKLNCKGFKAVFLLNRDDLRVWRGIVDQKDHKSL